MNNIYKVFTRKVAYMLVEKGFNVIGTENNLKKKHLKVYLFEDTLEFRKALTELSKKLKK